MYSSDVEALKKAFLARSENLYRVMNEVNKLAQEVQTLGGELGNHIGATEVSELARLAFTNSQND